MSASKDKILRKQQIEAGTDKRSIAAAEEAKRRRKSNIQYTVVAVLLVIVFAFIFIYNSAIPARHTTAVTIDGEKYTAAQLNYYYSSSYMSFYNNYYSYLQYGMFFDPSLSLKDQMYSEDMTWREYFLESAVDNMTEVQLLNNAAAAAGFTLSAEEQAEYEETVANIETSWQDLGYSSLKQYINMNYGTGVDMDIIRTELYRTFVASAYSQAMLDSYEYTPEELASYYAENAADYDVISYVYYADYDGTVDAEAVAAAVNGTSEEEFISYMEENYDVTPTSTSGTGSSVSDAYADWLTDSARAAGDVTTAVDETNEITYIVMFLDRDTNDYNAVNFRHILIQAEDTDGDGEFSAEEIAAAADEAQSVYDEWLAGDATEDSFAELANTYTDDSGSSTTGGLYEHVAKNQMVEPINDWIFDGTRQPGDTEIISYEGDNYTGTHVVYFVGTDDVTYAQTLADNAKRNADYTAWMEAAEDAAVVTTSHLGLCGKNH